ncbi:MAG TPA: SPOR domain-containing protein [Xanthobacteraceae bacterium]|nr:SPOR domain-containing protein [Xanthobacteraceae bacterium]
MIRANPEPAKVPPPASVDAQGKSTYERVGDRAQGERIVSREEAPVDLKDVVRPSAGRSPPQQSSTGQWASAAGTPSTAAAPSALGEPKKVRTVTIRPNTTDTNGVPSSLTPPAAAVAPPPPPQSAGPPSRSAPAQLSAPVSQVPLQQQATPPPKPPVATSVQSGAPPANAPLSLNEDSVLTLPRSLNEPRTAVSSRQPPVQRQSAQKDTAVAAAPPPQPLAQAPARGGYFVQVSSQRSEAEAQAALRGLQGKYPNLLGGQPAMVRQADLGTRGVFYRAVIGPYANREQATQLCNSLKAAGGDCFVSGN